MIWTPDQQQQLRSLIRQRHERDQFTRFLADAETAQTRQRDKPATLTN